MKHVYIIEAGNGHKKIGVAKDVKKRISQLKTGVSTGIKSVLISDKVENPYELENMLHSANSKLRLSGEWFDGDIDLCGIGFTHEQLEYENIEIFAFVDAIIAATKNKQAEVVGFMLKNMDKKHEVHCTQREISATLKISLPTVSNIISKLKKHGYIEQLRNGSYKFSSTLFPV
jgi:biotin operon repressor